MTHPSTYPHTLPPLKYGYAALAPVIDEKTMRLHHGKHHQAYVDGLNAALADHPELHDRTAEDLLRRLDDAPEAIRTQLRNQGGGHANHQFFWQILTPNGAGRPSGELATAIDEAFGSFDDFKAEFEKQGVGHFGSGWVFLAADPTKDHALEILTLPNQDSVLTLGKEGLITCDLWEHAYYLAYQNRRADWLKAWWEIIDWDYVAERFADLHEGRAPG